MTRTHFDITYPRKIEAAHKNRYSKGVRHPSRIMPQHDFVYIIKGEWEILQAGETYLAHEGDIVILTANAQHGGDKLCENGTETYYIHTDFTEGEEIHLNEFNEQQRCGENICVKNQQHIPLSALIHGNGSQRVQEDFRKIVECYAIDISFKEHRLTNLFNKLLIDLYDLEMGKKLNETELINQTELYFIRNMHRFVSNSEVASYILMGEKSYVEKFKALTGTTPYRYQNLFKMNQIQEVLITSPEIKLKELAQNYGFCDEFHLSKRFKQVYGVSPDEYRKTALA